MVAPIYSSRAAPAAVTRTRRSSGAASYSGNLYQKRTYAKATGDASGWPPSSPDLNPTDYFSRGWTQRFAGGKKPTTSPGLQVATRQAAEALPMEMAKKATGGFRKRARLTVQTEGKPFKHMTKKKHSDTPAPVGRQAEIVSAPIIAHDQQGAAPAGEEA